MTPQPNSVKSGAVQFDEMYNNLKNSQVTVRSVWIQITSPINWSSSIRTNIDFINSILARANTYGLTIGIYTNFYDWSQITGYATASNVMLWYWNVYGAGLSSESPANFDDFRPFAGWTVPNVKQFGQVESICNIEVNRNIFSTTAASTTNPIRMENFNKSQQIIVGGLGLKNTAFTGKPEIKL
ncbi:unnamed protein product [Angiostrongylus costaricensis]|uniref:Lysozyme n=1 Tax=Angiostrongylus costaricensis TaxID=334426 RepID=A0A0R3PHQ0_ANGCS|nr:unnamed protein product [Angiostrongylus costaricensis]